MLPPDKTNSLSFLPIALHHIDVSLTQTKRWGLYWLGRQIVQTTSPHHFEVKTTEQQPLLLAIDRTKCVSQLDGFFGLIYAPIEPLLSARLTGVRSIVILPILIKHTWVVMCVFSPVSTHFVCYAMDIALIMILERRFSIICRPAHLGLSTEVLAFLYHSFDAETLQGSLSIRKHFFLDVLYLLI